MTLPDDNARLLPETLLEGNPSPPLTREEEKRAHRVQVVLEALHGGQARVTCARAAAACLLLGLDHASFTGRGNNSAFSNL